MVVSEQKSMSKANKSKYNNCVIAPTNADVNERGRALGSHVSNKRCIKAYAVVGSYIK